MKELSLNIIDIAKNSVEAGARHIAIDIDEEQCTDRLIITVTDDGCGMSAELVKKVSDPFTTTRTTRPVGLGIPLLKMAAESTGGQISIESEPGRGTSICAEFGLAHIDRPPLGDIAGALCVLIQGSPDIDFVLTHKRENKKYTASTEDMRSQLGDVPLNNSEVMKWISGYITEQEQDIANT